MMDTWVHSALLYNTEPSCTYDLCMVHFKAKTSYYEWGSPETDLKKALQGVCELSQPWCGYSTAGLHLKAGLAHLPDSVMACDDQLQSDFVRCPFNLTRGV